MKKGSVSFSVTTDARAKRTLRLLGEWDRRFARAGSWLTWAAASWTRREIMEKLPKGDAFAAYRESLEVVRVQGGPKGVRIHAIRTNPRARRIRREDTPRTILHVRPKKSLRRAPERVRVLQKYGPWTPRNLPFTPKSNEAIIISRRVTVRHVLKVERARRRDRNEWLKALAKVGIRVPLKDRRFLEPERLLPSNVVPDVAFMGVRMEFGLGQETRRPHWRPALRSLVSVGLHNMVKRSPMLRDAFTRASFKEWKKWPPRTRRRMNYSEIKTFVEFQRRLAFKP